MNISSDKDWKAFCEAVRDVADETWRQEGYRIVAPCGERVGSAELRAGGWNKYVQRLTLAAAAPAMKAEIERLREVLAFYAKADWHGFQMDAVNDHDERYIECGDLWEDKGAKARTALTGEA